MKWLVEEQTIEMDGGQLSLEEQWAQVESQVGQSGKCIRSIVLEGEEVHSDFISYLIQCGENVQSVTVKTCSVEQMSGDLAASVQLYIEQAIPQVEELANRFYSSAGSEEWSQFAAFAEALEWLETASVSMQNHCPTKKLQKSFEQYQKKSGVILKQLGEALNQQDLSLMADLLKFEIIPVLEQLKNAAGELAKKYEGAYVS